MSIDTNPSAAERLAGVKSHVSAAAVSADRDPVEVHLVAVSKTFSAEEIAPVLEAGHRLFGENRVQEAKGKWPGLRERFSGIHLALIGPLQSNKAREAVELFDSIHSIDRPKIARAVADEMKRQDKTLELFIQVNTGEEEQKAGIAPAETLAFVRHCQQELGLSIKGLMCIPPVDEEPGLHFALLAKLAKEAGLDGLSMGMSADYETAIAFGATHVRIGSAIFGSRG